MLEARQAARYVAKHVNKINFQFKKERMVTNPCNDHLPNTMHVYSAIKYSKLNKRNLNMTSEEKIIGSSELLTSGNV